MVVAWSPANASAQFSTRSVLYVLAALLIGYFGVNAYSGDRGLKAKEDIDRQIAALTVDLDRLKLEHAQWQRRIALVEVAMTSIPTCSTNGPVRSSIMSTPNDLTMMFGDKPRPAAGSPSLGLESTPLLVPKSGFPTKDLMPMDRASGSLRRSTPDFRNRVNSAIGKSPGRSKTRAPRLLFRGQEWPSPKPSKRLPAPKAASRRRSGGQRDYHSPNSTRNRSSRRCGQMLLIRRFEEKAGQMYGMGLIGGFCHLYIGQEAVVVGMKLAMRDGDQMITGYRDHGHMLACGMDPKGVMAELTGRRGGYSQGKGGSMHMFSLEKQFYGGHGIVGAQVPLGTGLGLRQ